MKLFEIDLLALMGQIEQSFIFMQEQLSKQRQGFANLSAMMGQAENRALDQSSHFVHSVFKPAQTMAPNVKQETPAGNKVSSAGATPDFANRQSLLAKLGSNLVGPPKTLVVPPKTAQSQPEPSIDKAAATTVSTILAAGQANAHLGAIMQPQDRPQSGTMTTTVTASGGN